MRSLFLKLADKACLLPCGMACRYTDVMRLVQMAYLLVYILHTVASAKIHVKLCHNNLVTLVAVISQTALV